MIDALGRVEGRLLAAAADQRGAARRARPDGRAAAGASAGSSDAWILTSESCALDIIGARFVRDVEPGEIVIVDGNGLRSIKPFTKQQRRFCVFEHIYFARPDTRVEGVGVYDARKRIGMELAKESPVPADVVVPVPDSGVPAAIGYAAAVGHAVRARHHPQPLCRPHLHRAGRPYPPSRRAPEAQRQPRA